MAHRKGIALALGGGGARGLSHIGVLTVLHETGIKIASITGSSMGAVIGAMYSVAPDPAELLAKWRNFLVSDSYNASGLSYFKNNEASDEEEEGSFFRQVSRMVKGRVIVNIAQSKTSIVKRKRLTIALNHLIGGRSFDDCTIPLTVMATDLINGEPVKLTTGDLLPALEASSSIPGFLPPLEIDGRSLVDGSVAVPIPVNEAFESGARPVVAVGVSRKICPEGHVSNAIEIITRIENITSFHYSQELLCKADVFIVPKTGSAHWSEFSRLEEMVEKGAQATRYKMSELRRAIRRYSWWRWLLR